MRTSISSRAWSTRSRPRRSAAWIGARSASVSPRRSSSRGIRSVAEAVSDSTRPVAARVDTYRKIYDDNGPLEITSVDNATPTSLTITVNSAKGQTMSMSFEIEDGASGKLRRLAVNLSR